MNSEVNSEILSESEAEIIGKIIEDMRKMASVLGGDSLKLGDEDIILTYKNNIIENVIKIKSILSFDAPELVLIASIEKAIDYLDINGYTPDAFYEFQLESGV